MTDKKHIVVKDQTKDRFKKLRKSKGMTQDGLINFLMDQLKK
jgi:hypothetical protein